MHLPITFDPRPHRASYTCLHIRITWKHWNITAARAPLQNTWSLCGGDVCGVLKSRVFLSHNEGWEFPGPTHIAPPFGPSGPPYWLAKDVQTSGPLHLLFASTSCMAHSPQALLKDHLLKESYSASPIENSLTVLTSICSIALLIFLRGGFNIILQLLVHWCFPLSNHENCDIQEDREFV